MTPDRNFLPKQAFMSAKGSRGGWVYRSNRASPTPGLAHERAAQIPLDGRCHGTPDRPGPCEDGLQGRSDLRPGRVRTAQREESPALFCLPERRIPSTSRSRRRTLPDCRTPAEVAADPRRVPGRYARNRLGHQGGGRSGSQLHETPRYLRRDRGRRKPRLSLRRQRASRKRRWGRRRFRSPKTKARSTCSRT